jgi:hypothetical protein
MGVWAKAIGAYSNRTTTQSLSSVLPAAAALGDFDLSYRQDIYGVLGGVDFAGSEGLLVPYDAGVLGLIGGYVKSTLNFKNSPTSFDYSGPTAGLSATYLAGGWFADALVKADFLTLNMNFPTLAAFGYSGTSLKVTNAGGLANFGYGTTG